MISEWDRLPEKAKAIIRRHQANPPVSVGAIAHELGLSVKSATLKPGISGEIFPSKEEDGKYLIRVNRHEVHERQRFTVSHEISHFLLHREIIGAGVSDNSLYRSNLSDKREREANRLAAEILMPWHLIEREFEKGQISPEELAQQLGVSATAVKIRLGIPT